MNRKLQKRLPGSDDPTPQIGSEEVASEQRDSGYSGAKTLDKSDFRLPEEKSEAGNRKERLRQAIRAAGGNRVVAANSGVPISTLGGYLAGREWKVGSTAAIARACGVTLDWLIEGIVTPAKQDQLPERISSRSGVPSNYVLIPTLDVRASAGSGTMVDEERLIGLMAFDDMFLRRQLGVQSEHLATVEATGDSMEPTIRDGDLLLIDMSNKEIRDGRIYVINIDGFLSVKRLQIQFGGKIGIISDNTRYAPQIVLPSEREPLRIVGRVVYQAGPVRS